jgi:hypothetical protein
MRRHALCTNQGTNEKTRTLYFQGTNEKTRTLYFQGTNEKARTLYFQGTRRRVVHCLAGNLAVIVRTRGERAWHSKGNTM